MSTQNLNYSNLDGRYTKPTDVTAAIAAQAATDAGKYLTQSTAAATYQPANGYYRTKRISIPVGSDCSGTNTGFADAVTRNGIILPSNTIRWRVRVANYNYTYPSSSAYSGQINFTGVYVGTPLINSDGSWSGTFTSAPTLAAAGGSCNANEYVSPWVTASNLQFKAHVLTGISWGFTCPAGTTIAYSPNRTGRTFFSPGAAAQVGNAAVPTGSNNDSAQFLDVRIEYEALDALPVVLVISDSTAAGVIGDGSLNFAIPGHFGTWPGQAALKNNFHVINAAVSGTTYSNFTTSQWILQRFDLATSVPDVAIFGCGINDAYNSFSVSTWVSNLLSIRNALVGLGVPRTMVTTVMQQPRWKPGYLLSDVSLGATTILSSAAYSSGDTISVGVLTANAETITASATSTASATGGYTTTVSATTKSHNRNDTTGLVAEAIRVQYNQQARRGLGGMESVIDFDGAIKSSDPLFPWWGTDGVHPGAGAYALFGSLVKLT